MADSPKSRLSVLPAPLRPLAKSSVKIVRGFFNRLYDLVVFPLWIVFQCARRGKKAVIVCRPGALGDVLCALPMCAALPKRHPNAFIIFVTSVAYKKMVALSRAPDEIYGAKSWVWPFVLPGGYKFPGLVEVIYNPKTTDERVAQQGATCHLVDDLAASCGLTIQKEDRQPRLFPSTELITKAQAAHGLTGDVIAGRKIIGINCGYTWPVRMWDAPKWQALVDKMRADYNAVVLQFGFTIGFTTGIHDPYEHLRGVRLLTNSLETDELVALIAGCHLLVSIDSGPVHVAGAVGVPVVGLFGAVNPDFRLPRESRATGVFSNVPCLFCHHTTPRGHWEKGCPHDIQCMKQLDVETVFQAVKGILSDTK